MSHLKSYQVWISILIVAFAAVAASAQSFRVQCPTSTITHPLTGTACITNPTGTGVQQHRTSVQRTDAIQGRNLWRTRRDQWGLCHADCRNRERRHQVPANLGR